MSPCSTGRHGIRVSAAVAAAVVTALAICMPRAAAQEDAQPAAGWVELPRRGYNAIWVVPTTGDLFISNGKVIEVSRDRGGTFEPVVEPQQRGRHFNSIGFDGDPTGQRLALFPIDSPVGRLTVDGGRAWSTFAKPTPPQVRKHDGWTYGAVHWAAEKPTRLFGKEHHSANLWLSDDAGETWAKIDGAGGYYGIGVAADGALMVGKTSDNKSRGPEGEPGLYRSTDDGRTWQLALAAEMHQKVKPHRHGQTMVWPTVPGLAVSRDGGVTWAMMPDSPKHVLFGPFFGDGPDDMLVVNERGVHRTADGGKTWSLAMPREQMPQPVRDANFAPLKPNFAWDPGRNILYATSMGVPLFKVDLGTGSADK